MKFSNKTDDYQKLLGGFVAVAGILLMCYSLTWSQTITHRILIGGCDLGYSAIVGRDVSFEWKFAENYENDDVWLLPNGNIIWAYKFGVKLVKPNYAIPAQSKVLWNRPTRSGGETHSCQPLDGSSHKFLIGESFETISYIVEVDTAGKEWKRIALPRFGSGAHGQFRQIRKTPQNTYLVTQQTTNGKAFEYDNTGKLLRTFPDGRYAAYRLANGNTLIACGDVGRAIEVDTANNIVWQVQRTEIQGNGFTVSLGFVAGLLRLPNGNTVICNWGGHGGATGAAVIEITPDKKLVWSINSTIATSVASIQLLDDCDSTRPAATRAVALSPLTLKKVAVTFSKSIDSTSAGTLANYLIGQGITITAAMFQPDGITVMVTTGQTLVASTTYTLTINNVLDNASPANKIPANSRVTIEMPTNVITDKLTIGGLINLNGSYSKLSVYTLQGRLLGVYTVGRGHSIVGVTRFLAAQQNEFPAGLYMVKIIGSHEAASVSRIIIP